MATTVNCDICKTEIKGDQHVLIDGGIYTLQVNAFHLPMNARRIDDICVKCLAKKLQVVDLQGVAA